MHMCLATRRPAGVLSWGVAVPVELCRLVAQHNIELHIHCDPQLPEAETGADEAG
jgi:hypothetical protein